MSSSENKDGGSAALEISIEKSDLVKELAIAQGVVERKATIPILSSILFETSGNNALVTATDLDLSLRTSCPATVKKPGSCTIPARKFYDYLRLLPDGEITIKALANDWVQIRSGRSHTKMAGLPRGNFPKLPSFPADSTIQLPAATLHMMISKTIVAVSQEESRYTLNAALFIVQPQSLTMVATDGHRLAHIEVKANVSVASETKVLVPKKALAEMQSLLNANGVDTVEFAKNESTLFFRVGSRILTSQKLTGAFPSYEAVMPRDFPHSITVPNLEFSRGIQRVAQFADLHSSAVRLKIEKQQLRLAASNPETGESEETLETNHKGNPLTLSFNSRYLLDFAKIAGTENVSFHFKASDVAAELRPDASANSESIFRYIVMPMRV